MARPLGTIAGRYRLERELGRGSFGAVYAATVGDTGQQVAVKLLGRAEPSAAARFGRELDLMRRVPPHAGVVTVLDGGTHDGLPFIVMELVVGGSLAGALDAGRWPPLPAAVALVAKVARALAHLHDAGVLHRDVNARNVLLDASGSPKLGDFGIGIDLERVSRLTATGELVGTPHALAPEQFDRGPAAVGSAVDVYAAGVLLYELLSRAKPFGGAVTLAELAALKRRPPPRLPEGVRVPGELAAVLERALSVEAAQRPTAAELGAVLEGLRFDARSPVEPAPTPAPALMIGRYRVERRLGSGGAGTVFRAVDPVMGRAVAIKLLTRNADASAARGRFDREARAIASLHHPGIVVVHDKGEHAGTPFLVLELVEGETLAERLTRPIAPSAAAATCAAVARALAHAHERGVIHRDVKPSNILIARDGAVRLTDFGIARVASETRLTATGGIVGTIAYMSPEQLRGEDPTGATDVYSVGSPGTELEFAL